MAACRSSPNLLTTGWQTTWEYAYSKSYWAGWFLVLSLFTSRGNSTGIQWTICTIDKGLDRTGEHLIQHPTWVDGKVKQGRPLKLTEISRTMMSDFGLFPSESWTVQISHRLEDLLKMKHPFSSAFILLQASGNSPGKYQWSHALPSVTIFSPLHYLVLCFSSLFALLIQDHMLHKYLIWNRFSVQMWKLGWLTLSLKK